MIFTPFEFTDDNNNSFPTIYASVASPTNSAPFYHQVNTHFESLRRHGFRNVPVSAYLDKCVFNNYECYDFIMDPIRQQLSRSAMLPKQENHRDVVFVWDIDEIAMLSRNHLAELSILRVDINTLPLYNLMKRIITHLKFDDINELRRENVVNIEDVLNGESYATERFSHKYDALKTLYNQFSDDINLSESIISHELLEKLDIVEQESTLCETAKKHQHVFNNRWKLAKKSLKLVNRRSAKSKNNKYANVVMTNQEFGFGATQLLLSGASSIVPIENIYSTLRVSEDLVFERIKKRFGEKSILIHVTSGPLDFDRSFHTWPVRANESVKFLYDFQKDILI